MTIEERLKELILLRYDSVREFGKIVDIPNSTLRSIFQRGVDNASISNIIKICKELKISVDELAEGRITPNIPANNVGEMVEIKEIISDTKQQLLYGYDLTLNGKKIDRECVEVIIDSIDVGVELANNKNITKTTFHNEKIH